MNNDNAMLRERYVKLIKNALLFSLWPEPPMPLTHLNEISSPAKRLAIAAVTRALDSQGLQLVKCHALSPRLNGKRAVYGPAMPIR